MSYDSFEPVVFDKLGGRFDFLNIEDVPPGFSPDCQNVRFKPGSVYSRSVNAGTTSVFTSAGHTFYGLGQFIDNSLTQYLLTIDEACNLAKQNGAGVTSIKSAIGIAGSLMRTVVQNNRLYIGLFGSKMAPQGPIRLYDGTNLDLFSPSGPGGKDHLASTGNTHSNTTVDNVTEIATWSVGDTIVDSNGVIPAGTTVSAINLATSTLTISQAATGTVTGVTLSWGGFTVADAADAGQIIAGVRGVAISFITRSGYTTEPTAPVYWLAAGSKKVNVTGIPVGPPHVVARQVYFTLSGALDFYFVATFQINDNTTTSAEFDFAETDLTNGSLVNDLFDNYRLPDQAAVNSYNGRTVVWGGYNQATVNSTQDLSTAFTNAGFDGGARADGVPMGWEKGANFGFGTPTLDQTSGNFAGGAWKIAADGAHATEGEIVHCEARQRFLANTAYNISLRAWATGGVTGSVQVKVIGTGLALTAFTVPLASLTGTPQEFHGVLLRATDITGVPPVDLQVSVSFINSANGETVWIDHIIVTPAARPYESSATIRVSDAFDPERFDGINGFINFDQDDGQRIVACMQLRWYYYIFKERSMHVTFDDGSNPPSLWTVNQVSGVAGAASPNAVAGYKSQSSTEDFIVTAAVAGAFVFFGGRPAKVSQEIQKTWNRINWAAKSTIHVVIDSIGKTIRFFVPLDNATQPTVALVLDYLEGFGTDTEPGGRKWGYDVYPTAINASALVESSSGTEPLYFTGAKVWQESGTTDDGTAIDCYYETSFARASDKQGEPWSGTSLFGGASYTASGSGTLQSYLLGLGTTIADITATPPPPSAVRLPDTTLIAQELADVELYANIETERARLRWEANGVASDGVTGDSFQVKRAVVWTKPWARQRPK